MSYYNESHVEQMHTLKTSEGWQIIAAWLNERIQYHKNHLISCKLEEVETHRAQVRTFEAVLNKPQHIIEEVTEHTVDQHS
jgi:predicted metal-dependent HD superfamily phosphohydrolase